MAFGVTEVFGTAFSLSGFFGVLSRTLPFSSLVVSEGDGGYGSLAFLRGLFANGRPSSGDLGLVTGLTVPFADLGDVSPPLRSVVLKVECCFCSDSVEASARRLWEVAGWRAGLSLLMSFS